MISKILEAQRHASTGEAPDSPRTPACRSASAAAGAAAEARAWTGLLGWLVVAAIAGAAYYYVPLETWKSLLAKVLPATAPATEVKGPRASFRW